MTTKHKMYRLDSSGHGLVTEWSDTKEKEIDAAAAFFVELQQKGFTMFALQGAETKEIMKKFDPTAEEILAVPRLQGG